MMKKLWYAGLLLSWYLHSNDNKNLIIFAPSPLIDVPKINCYQDDFVQTIKKYAFPITLLFYYCIHKNNPLLDIVENPYTSSLLFYGILHYYWNKTVEKQEQNISQETIHIMQSACDLVIIGQGLYNEIKLRSYRDTQTHELANYTLNELQQFLENAYNTWSILFSYYKDHYKNKPLFAYHMEQINIFEVLQASAHQPDILNLVTHFYDKNNNNHDCQAIIIYLEHKLSMINQKVIKALPLQYFEIDKK